MSDRTLQEWITLAYSSAEYHEKLKQFHERHREASYIEYHTEAGIPTRAVYLFEPYHVAVDNMTLAQTLATNSENKAQQEAKE